MIKSDAGKHLLESHRAVVNNTSCKFYVILNLEKNLIFFKTRYENA